MQKKWVIIINLIILIVITFFLISMSFQIFSNSEVITEEECVEVNKVTSFVYDICFDPYAKTIFVNVDRSNDNYNLESFEFSFFDLDNKFYVVSNVPDVGNSKAYRIPAEKNPENLNIRMNIIKDFSAPICRPPRMLFVKYCPIRPTGQEFNADISPFSNITSNDFIDVGLFKDSDSDLFAMDLVDKEAIWENSCSSNWQCDAWEECIDGIQRRECEDLKKCYVPTKKPKTTKYCNGICVENWECQWSECRDGFTTPDCKDKNNCGTTIALPQKLNCGYEDEQCIPNIVCGAWSSCKVDYNFLDLMKTSISDLYGSKSRICNDNNECSIPQTEVRNCSVSVDIYTKRFDKCGKEYIGVYNRLDNNLIARMNIEINGSPNLNLFLDDKANSKYCDYCFNNILDADEIGIDCGGSCMKCSEKYNVVEFKKKSWWKFW